MGKEELAAIVGEAEGAEAAQDAERAGEDQAGFEADQVDPEPTRSAPDQVNILTNENLPLVCRGLVAAVGKVACRRARVTDLEPAEVDALGDAVAGVVRQYDLTIDPKVAAWLSLGLVTVQVVGNRDPLEKTGGGGPGEPVGADPVVEGAEGAEGGLDAPQSYVGA